MSPDTKSLLLPFHFGSIDDQDRLVVERELLTDTDILVDYLDLKRSLESAEMIPLPSKSVWIKLQESVQTRKKVIIPLSFGAAIAASVLAAFIYVQRPLQDTTVLPQNRGEGILFDTRTELPANSSVL